MGRLSREDIIDKAGGCEQEVAGGLCRASYVAIIGGRRFCQLHLDEFHTKLISLEEDWKRRELRPTERVIDLAQKGVRVRIKDVAFGVGLKGTVIGPAHWAQQWWIPVMWDNEYDPSWHSLTALEKL